MINVFNTLAECFFTGIVAGLTIVGCARVGLLPILLYKQVDDEEDEDG